MVIVAFVEHLDDLYTFVKPLESEYLSVIAWVVDEGVLADGKNVFEDSKGKRKPFFEWSCLPKSIN